MIIRWYCNLITKGIEVDPKAEELMIVITGFVKYQLAVYNGITKLQLGVWIACSNTGTGISNEVCSEYFCATNRLCAASVDNIG